MFNNHKYEILPFEVKSARPNTKKYPHLRKKTAIVGCHACGWYDIKAKAMVTMKIVGYIRLSELTCPRCGHTVQFANIDSIQSHLIAP